METSPQSSGVVEESIRGALACERGEGVTPLRLPARAFEQMAEPYSRVVARHAGGVRVEIVTAATELVLDARIIHDLSAPPGSWTRSAVFAVTSGAETLAIASTDELGDLDRFADTGRHDVTLTFDLGENASGSPRRLQLWLPHDVEVELLALRGDAPWHPDHSPDVRWVHHGSSISHCLEATGPLGTWPVIVARSLGLDLTNIGLAGNAMLDPYVARALRDVDADLISIKVGINIVNGDAFTSRTFIPALHGFLDTVREGHSATPIVVISPVYCGIHEDTTGPTTFDPQTGMCSAAGTGNLTLSDVRRLVTDVVSQRSKVDTNLYLLDGRRLLGEEDAHYLGDRLHPNPAGYELIARRFLRIARASPYLPLPPDREVASDQTTDLM